MLFWLLFLSLTNDQRPEPRKKNTIQFKGRIGKEVEIRLDQSLVYVKFPKYHTPTVWKKRVSLPTVKGMPAQ